MNSDDDFAGVRAAGMEIRNRPPQTPLSGVFRIVCFFALIALLAAALDSAISLGLRRIPTSKFGSLNKIVSGTVNAEIVINGSSRALTHYDPRVITEATGKSAYNLGMNGVQVDVQLALLETYLKRNSKPQLVVQNLESFIFETTKKGELYDPALYIPYISVDELYYPLLKIDPSVWKWRHIPLYGYTVEDMRFTWVRGILGCFGIYGREDYYQGFNPRYMEWTQDFERFRTSVGNGVEYRIEQQGMAALRQVIKTCQARKIDLLLVYSPEYFEMQALERNRAEIFATIQRLCDEFRVPLWDYSESPISRRRENFYNSQHLNARGASLFSSDLARRLSTHLKTRTPGVGLVR